MRRYVVKDSDVNRDRAELSRHGSLEYEEAARCEEHRAQDAVKDGQRLVLWLLGSKPIVTPCGRNTIRSATSLSAQHQDQRRSFIQAVLRPLHLVVIQRLRCWSETPHMCEPPPVPHSPALGQPVTTPHDTSVARPFDRDLQHLPLPAGEPTRRRRETRRAWLRPRRVRERDLNQQVQRALFRTWCPGGPWHARHLALMRRRATETPRRSRRHSRFLPASKCPGLPALECCRTPPSCEGQSCPFAHRGGGHWRLDNT